MRSPLVVEPASTMMMSIPPLALRPPATVISNTDSAMSSWVGKAIHSPFLRARRVAPTALSKGIPEISRAAEAPLSPMTS